MPKYTVLVVEDNQDILDSVRLLLEYEGYEVVAAENCSKGLAYLARGRPDVILTDLMMPEMTGLEFIHHIRRISNYDGIPIIAMSAYDKSYLASAVVAGAETTLHKPEDMDVLVQTVNEVLFETSRSESAKAL